MKARRAIVFAAALLVAAMAKSGHELPVYPSYYPHEIEIRTIAPEDGCRSHARGQAARLCRRDPGFAGASAQHRSAPWNRSGLFVVVRLDPDSPLAADEASACATAEAIVRDMAARPTPAASPSIPIRSRPGMATISIMSIAPRTRGSAFWAAERRRPPASRCAPAARRRASLVRAEWLAEGRALGCQRRRDRRLRASSPTPPSP